MEYRLRNGKSVVIRNVVAWDAEAVIHIISTADRESKFLARNPGELSITVEKERELIQGMLSDDNSEWYIAEYDQKAIGQCSVGLIRKNERFRHRAGVAFVILEEYCNLGIGGKMMEECIKWCKDKGVTQIELEVVKGNDRAIKMYQDFGFEIVGTMPNALRYLDGTYADEYTMIKYI